MRHRVWLRRLLKVVNLGLSIRRPALRRWGNGSETVLASLARERGRLAMRGHTQPSAARRWVIVAASSSLIALAMSGGAAMVRGGDSVLVFATAHHRGHHFGTA